MGLRGPDHPFPLIMFTQDRQQLRGFFCEVWRKRTAGEALEPLEAMVADIVGQHPEYHELLADPDRARDKDFTPDMGTANPFLHLGMHLAIREQLQTDRPAGLRALHERLTQRVGDPHEAEHRIMECLGEVLWTAQRQGTPPDEAGYVDCVRRLAGGTPPA